MSFFPEVSSQSYINWTRNNVLPFWAERAFDRQKGGWYEKLDLNGKPDTNSNRRLRVTSRQIFTYCCGYDCGWWHDLELIWETFDWWWKTAWHADGAPGFCHLISADLEILSHKRDTYDHAFAVLALLWLFKISGDGEIKSRLDMVIAFMDENLKHPSGGYVEYWIPNEGSHLSTRRQNPHMHLFETFTAAERIIPNNGFKTRVQEIYNLFNQHFFNLGNSSVIEYFNNDWSHDQRTIQRRIEPGHLAEWVWLLNEANHILVLDKSMQPLLDLQKNNLYESAIKTGCHDSGLILDWYDPKNEQTSDTARSWPTMELVRAALITNDDDRVNKGLNSLKRIFLPSRLNGGWYDTVRFNSNKYESDSWMQTSTAYHVIGLARALQDKLKLVRLHSK